LYAPHISTFSNLELVHRL